MHLIHDILSRFTFGYIAAFFLMLQGELKSIAVAVTPDPRLLDLLLSRSATIIGIMVGVITFMVQLENWKEKRRSRDKDNKNE